MKKAIAILLLMTCLISLASCEAGEPREISCEEIIEAYEAAGYRISYHNHGDPIYNDSRELCNIEIEDPDDPEKNYIYITRYFTPEDAKAAAEKRSFNPALWLIFVVYGEWRWLQSGVYGDIYYTSFDSKILKPIKELTK